MVSHGQWPKVSDFVACFCTLPVRKSENTKPVQFSHVRVFSDLRVQFSHVRVFSDLRNMQKSVT